MSSNFSAQDTTKPLIEPDEKFGVFEPDPNDQFVQRYIPSDDELARLNEYLKDELDTAWNDDLPSRNKKLDLLKAYHGIPDDDPKAKILTLPLIRRAVNQNVAWIKNTIMQKRPLVTVTPDSGGTITVLVQDPQFGAVPLEKTSEEVAQALEAWLEYKLRKRIDFDRIVETAALEAKRGQTPTYLKVVHKKETRKVRAPKFEKSGPVGVTFQSKEEIDVQSAEPTRIVNVSTYSMLMPADEQDVQESRWIAERVPKTNEQLRACLYNGDYFLIKKAEWEEIIENGAETAATPEDATRSAIEKRVSSIPKGTHDIWEVWLCWTVPMKQSLVSIDGESGEQKSKTITVNQEYSMVGHYHRKLGRLLSLIRNPFDHGKRPYIPVFDRKEPFRHTGESLAEDVFPYQKIESQLNSLEVKGGVIATTPVIYAEPGSIAGEWVMGNDVEPGSIIPRNRPDEVEAKPLGERPQSLIGLIEFHDKNYQRDTSLGDIRLGLELPGRTPASTLAQVMSAGETLAMMFLEGFRRDLGEALKLYVQTVQQYLRFGETIPFDPETTATIMAALQSGQDAGVSQSDLAQGIPVRFPMDPIHEQFAFNITASSEDRSMQNDFERLVALKNLIDSDGSIVAKMIGPMASGQLPDSIMAILVADFARREKAMELIAKAMRKDGGDFAISQKLLTAMVQEQKQMEQMRAMAPPPPPPPPQVKISLSGQLTPQQEQIAAASALGGNGGAAQGTGPQSGVGVPNVPNQPGAVGGSVPQPGVPPNPVGPQGGIPPAGPRGPVA